MWIEERVTIANTEGLHARPARELWETARKFVAEVRILYGRSDADAKSIFDIMGLGADRGSELLIRARGPDAEAAVRAVVRLVSTGFTPKESRKANP